MEELRKPGWTKEVGRWRTGPGLKKVVRRERKRRSVEDLRIREAGLRTGRENRLVLEVLKETETDRKKEKGSG